LWFQLKLEKWDADYEDLPGGKMKTKDITALEAACSVRLV